jgi:hypothetical protein
MAPKSACARIRAALSCARFRGRGWRHAFSELQWLLLDCCLDGMDRGARLLGPVLLLLASAIVALDVHLYFAIVAPTLGASPFSPRRAAATAVGLFALFNLVANYVICVVCDPGVVRGKSLAEVYAMAAELDPSYRLAPPTAPDALRWCEDCASFKPRRVHHCSVCNACVLKMDHHCPWLANCVGARTYPYFVRTLAWGVLACAFMCGAGAPAAWAQVGACDPSLAAALGAPARNPSPLHLSQMLDAGPPARGRLVLEAGGGGGGGALAAAGAAAAGAAAAARAGAAALRAFLSPAPGSGCVRAFLTGYLVTGALGLALCALGGFHAYLAATGQSSIEFYKNRGAPPPRPRHAFDAGSAAANYRAVFRTRSCARCGWLCLPSCVGLGRFGVGHKARLRAADCGLLRRACGGGRGGGGGGGGGGEGADGRGAGAWALPMVAASGAPGAAGEAAARGASVRQRGV